MDGIRLSTGVKIERSGESLAEEIDTYERLLLAIVDEQFESAPLARAPADPWAPLFEGMRSEIDYLLQNEISDHTAFLRTVLIIDAAKTLQGIAEEGNKPQRQPRRP